MEHQLPELVPLMSEAGFADTEVGPVDYRIAFLSVLGFARGRTGS